MHEKISSWQDFKQVTPQNTTKSSRLSADRKRKFFQRKGTSSAPNSSQESDHYSRNNNNESVVSRALEEALRTSTILGWDTQVIEEPSPMTSLSSLTAHCGLNAYFK